jgi:4'-phosphopantetheinyl transferase
VDELFLSCWTRKEAMVKAWGAGLGVPLSAFDVGLEPASGVVALRLGESRAESDEWSLLGLPPLDGYVGAVAVAGRPPTLRCWRWAT